MLKEKEKGGDEEEEKEERRARNSFIFLLSHLSFFSLQGKRVGDDDVEAAEGDTWKDHVRMGLLTCGWSGGKGKERKESEHYLT